MLSLWRLIYQASYMKSEPTESYPLNSLKRGLTNRIVVTKEITETDNVPYVCSSVPTFIYLSSCPTQHTITITTLYPILFCCNIHVSDLSPAHPLSNRNKDQ